MAVMQETIRPTISDVLSAAKKLTRTDLIRVVQELTNIIFRPELSDESKETEEPFEPTFDSHSDYILYEHLLSNKVDYSKLTQGEKMAAALEMASRIESPLSTLDAVAWQREIRTDKVLVGRENDGD